MISALCISNEVDLLIVVQGLLSPLSLLVISTSSLGHSRIYHSEPLMHSSTSRELDRVSSSLLVHHSTTSLQPTIPPDYMRCMQISPERVHSRVVSRISVILSRISREIRRLGHSQYIDSLQSAISPSATRVLQFRFRLIQISQLRSRCHMHHRL